MVFFLPLDCLFGTEIAVDTRHIARDYSFFLFIYQKEKLQITLVLSKNKISLDFFIFLYFTQSSFNLHTQTFYELTEFLKEKYRIKMENLLFYLD